MRNSHSDNIGLLADELTSAADGAAPFVAGGLSARIGRGQLPRRAAAVLAVARKRRAEQPRHKDTL